MTRYKRYCLEAIPDLGSAVKMAMYISIILAQQMPMARGLQMTDANLSTREDCIIHLMNEISSRSDINSTSDIDATTGFLQCSVDAELETVVKLFNIGRGPTVSNTLGWKGRKYLFMGAEAFAVLRIARPKFWKDRQFWVVLEVSTGSFSVVKAYVQTTKVYP